MSVQGVRFEVPSRYRMIQRPTIHYVRWDLSAVDLVVPVSGQVLCAVYPLDRERNASGRRAALQPVMTREPIEPRPRSRMAPRASSGHS